MNKPVAAGEDEPSINGLRPADIALLSDWYSQAKVKLPSEDVLYPILRDLNYAQWLSFCWHPDAAPVRRLGPTWAPKKMQSRGRPRRLENNLANNLKKKFQEGSPDAYEVNINFIVESAMIWLGVDKSAATLSRAGRRRKSARHATSE